MKITVELPESDLSDICRMTGIAKKGPAIRCLVDEALQLRRRREIAGKFLTGEWGVDLLDYEDAKVAEHAQSQIHASTWRD